MDNAATRIQIHTAKNYEEGLNKFRIRIPGQVFLFRLFINKIVLDKEDLNRIPLFSKLNEE